MTDAPSNPPSAEPQPVRADDGPAIAAYLGVVAAALVALLAVVFPSTALSALLVPVILIGGLVLARQAVQERRARLRSDMARRIFAKDAARLEVFLHNARDGIHILDTEGRIVDASDSFCRMLGYDRAEVEGMHVSAWDALEPAQRLSSFIPQLFARAETTTFETRHRRKDGSVFDVEVSGCPIDMNGRRVLFHSSRDITDRKALEARYREIYATVLSAKEPPARA